VRIATKGIRARIGTIECSLANVSRTGAMLLCPVKLPIGHEAALVIETEHPMSTKIRVARCDPRDVALPGAVWQTQEQALGVTFLNPSADVRQALGRLMHEASGVERASPRVLVLGEDDPISRLIDSTLTEADYTPRLLTDPGEAVRFAKKIGAKAVLVNLRIDPEFSARWVLDAIRADLATAKLPVIICARQAWIQPAHRSYLEKERLRLLLVPFTPEELVALVDRAISEHQA
jgi:CheY-like chemotaxis protein